MDNVKNNRGLEETVNQDELDETKLSILVRKYRAMEDDRYTYSSEPSLKLKTVRLLNQIYAKEKKSVESDLIIATSPSKLKYDAKINKTLRDLLDKYECLGNNIQEEKDQLAKMNFQIKQMQRQISKLQKLAPSDKFLEQKKNNEQKKIQILENKLDAFVKRFNMTTVENAKLRTEVDHLLQERNHFNELWYLIVFKLNFGKKILLDLIEQSSVAYNERDEWNKKLEVIRNKGKLDIILHKKEMRALNIKLSHSEQLKQFLGTKGQKRILTEFDNKVERKKEKIKREMKEQLANYEKTFQQITKFCGQTDLIQLIESFRSKEMENFSILNYIVDINYESEKLSAAIKDLKINIDEERKISNERLIQQKNDIQNLQAVLDAEAEKALEAADNVDKFDEKIQKLFDGIDQIFLLLQCDDDPIFDLLMGMTSLLSNPEDEVLDMTRHNILLCCSIIENRVTELMQIVYNKESTEATKVKRGKPPPVRIIKPDLERRYDQPPITVLVPSQPCPLCVEVEQVSDVIDALQHPKDHIEVVDSLAARLTLPHALDRLHNVSACQLPESRRIIQARYQ